VPSLLDRIVVRAHVLTRFYIRGIGNTDFDLNASQPVSLVYDDVVLENPILKGFRFVDWIRSKSFAARRARCSDATRRPASSSSIRRTDDGYRRLCRHQLSATTSTANLEGAIGGALSDTWSARLSILGQHRDNWVDNTAPGRSDSFGGYNERAARLQFAWQPSDSFHALFNMHALNLDGSAILFRANIIAPGTDDLVPGFKRDQISLDGQNFQHVTEYGGDARLVWDFNNMELVSITGFEKVKTLSHGDIDGGYGASFAPPFGPGFIPFPSESADGLPFHRQITEEVHLSSKDTGPLDWIVGVYYFNENITIDSFDYNTLAGSTQDGYARQQQFNVSSAIFGSLGYQITDQFKLKGGVRFTQDDKNYVAQRFVSPFGAPPVGPIYEDPSYDHTNWDLSGVWTASPTTDLYARVATGFRAPAIQGRLLFGDTVSVAQAETVTSGEIGIKSRLFDNRASISFDLFDYEMKNQQLTAVGGTANFNRLINAKKTNGHGFELDAQAYLTDRLMVTFGTSYNDTKIDDPNLAIQPCGSGCTVLDPPGPTAGTVLIDGNPLPQAPKWISNLTARYGIPVGEGEWFVYTDWAYRSKVSFFLYHRSSSAASRGSKADCAWVTTGPAASAKSPCSAATSRTRKPSPVASTSTT
jgi:iron complex outermembrane receptor protein